MNKLKMIIAMLIFGTLGIFITKIPLPSSVIAMSRSIIGTIFIASVMLIKRRKLDWNAIRKNALPLILSGTALGFNWILLFEAYRYTTVAVATLCYYMAPVFIILLSPLILKEKLTTIKVLCSAAAIIGAVMISGASVSGGQDMRGVLFGLSAALLYCSIVMINKFIRDLPDEETTLMQLGISAVVMIPYVLLTENISSLTFNATTIVFVLIVGAVHTGLAYLLYFGSLKKISAQTSAVFSYIDPVTAIILSAILLRQPMTALQVCGTVLILGATLSNELLSRRLSK